MLANTVGVAVSGNTILYPAPSGIALNTSGRLASISGNTIIDPFSNSAMVGKAVGIITTGNDNGMSINGNTIEPYNKAATYLLGSPSGQGIRLGAGARISAVASGNKITATFPIIDNNSVLTAIVTANATTPVVVPNANVTANSIITLQPATGETGNGAFISAIIPGVSFSINSFAGDTSDYIWQLQQ